MYDLIAEDISRCQQTLTRSRYGPESPVRGRDGSQSLPFLRC